MKAAKLYADAGANSNERSEGAFVESKSAFVGEDAAGTGEGRGVLGCRLQTDFYYVW